MACYRHDPSAALPQSSATYDDVRRQQAELHVPNTTPGFSANGLGVSRRRGPDGTVWFDVSSGEYEVWDDRKALRDAWMDVNTERLAAERERKVAEYYRNATDEQRELMGKYGVSLTDE
jgi:hypothetical protein